MEEAPEVRARSPRATRVDRGFLLGVVVLVASALGMGAWYVRVDGELDATNARQSAVRVHIEKVTSLRRDTRKAHVALLERWLKSPGDDASRAALAGMVQTVVEEHAEFAGLASTSEAEAEASARLATVGAVWSKEMSQTLEGRRDASRLGDHQEALAAVDKEADAILKLNSGLGLELDARSASLNDQKQWIEKGLLAAVLAAVGLGVLWSARRRTEALVARAALREEARIAKLRSEFFSTMSHELRTPLVAITNLTATFEHDAERAAQEKAVAHIDREARDLLAVINNILDLAKLESISDKFLIEDIELQSVLERCIARCRPLLRGKTVELEVDVPDEEVFVRGDFVKLQQVFTNLIANAIKFTSKGKVTVRATPPKSGRVEIEVTDTGVGMSARQIETIWQPFEQGGAETAKKFGGTGLGLAIVKGVLDRLDGSVEVSSVEGQGSTFRVTLPVGVRVLGATNPGG